MRLIDADALKPISASFDGKIIFIVTLDEIRNAPTVNPEPTRYGHWVEMERGHYFKCSECRNPIPYRFGWKFCSGVVENNRYYNFCPNCGADMRKDSR